MSFNAHCSDPVFYSALKFSSVMNYLPGTMSSGRLLLQDISDFLFVGYLVQSITATGFKGLHFKGITACLVKMQCPLLWSYLPRKKENHYQKLTNTVKPKLKTCSVKEKRSQVKTCSCHIVKVPKDTEISMTNQCGITGALLTPISHQLVAFSALLQRKASSMLQQRYSILKIPLFLMY